MTSLLQFFNIITKLSTLGIFNQFFNKHPKTGASAGAALVLTLVTQLFNYLGVLITPDQAAVISKGILEAGGILAIHFMPSPLKSK